MANFCKYCGTSVPDGYICGCPQAQADYQAQQAAYQAQQAAYQAQQAAYQAAATPQYAAPVAAPAAPKAENALLTLLKNYWKSPKAAAAAAAESKNGMMFAGIFAGANFLAIFFFLWRIIGLLLKTVLDAAGGSGVDMSDLKDYLELEQPIFPMLLAAMVIVGLGVAVTVMAIFVAAKINKKSVDFKKLLVMEGIHTLIPTALLFTGILLGFIAWWLQFLALAIILVLWFINVCDSIREVADVQMMDSGKALAINAGVVFSILAIGVWLITAIGGWSIGELSIQDVTLNEVFEEADGLLNMIGSGMF